MFRPKTNVHISKQKRSKLVSKAEKGIVVGSAPRCKKYKSLNLKANGTVSISKIVYINEYEKTQVLLKITAVKAEAMVTSLKKTIQHSKHATITPIQ